MSTHKEITIMVGITKYHCMSSNCICTVCYDAIKDWKREELRENGFLPELIFSR